tara:strand:- start:138 stop:575 length:438 start_codon:yes stop_codon:yes gene_type:complete
MAEGILRATLPSKYEILSAGSHPSGKVHPVAVEVMQEIGIDLSNHQSTHLDDYLEREIHTVITVCGNVHQICPVFPGQINRYHWGFDDPAGAVGSVEEVRAKFRRVRDQIRLVFEAYASGLIEASHAVRSEPFAESPASSTRTGA